MPSDFVPDANVFTAETILRNYVHAKDENRPRLLDMTFEIEAVLEVRNASRAISFPAMTKGRSGIADVLVRTFGQTYENVYTFYLQRPGSGLREFSCDWLVAMTEKATRAVRVGGGRYDWAFGKRAPALASRLVISISTMPLLPASAMPAVFSWIERLTYPWSSREEVSALAPALPELSPLLELFAGRGGDV